MGKVFAVGDEPVKVVCSGELVMTLRAPIKFVPEFKNPPKPEPWKRKQNRHFRGYNR